MTMSQSDLAQIAETLRCVGERMEKYADRSAEPGHLGLDIEQLQIQAGRLFIEAVDAGAFPESQASRKRGWWDRTKGRLPGGPFTVFNEVPHQRGEPLPGDTPEYKMAAAGEFDAEQIAKCWLFAIKWLTDAFPSRFRDQAAGCEWARVARDKYGQLLGTSGKRLRGYWYKDGERLEECSLAEACRRMSGKLPEGKYSWSLDGQIAHKHDFYDDATWSHHHRVRAEVQADACRLLAELIENASPTKPLSAEDATVRLVAEARRVAECVRRLPSLIAWAHLVTEVGRRGRQRQIREHRQATCFAEAFEKARSPEDPPSYGPRAWTSGSSPSSSATAASPRPPATWITSRRSR